MTDPSPRLRWRRVGPRLLPLAVASVAVHAIVLLWWAQPALRLPQQGAGAALAVSLARPAVAASPAPSLAPAASPAESTAVQARSIAARTPAPPSAAAASQRAPAPPLALAGGWDTAADPGDPSAAHVPGFQAVQTPPSAYIEYAVTSSGNPAAATATLDWQLDDQGYRLQLAGENGVIGPSASRGQMADNGFVPVSFSTGSGSVTFDWSSARATFTAGPLTRAASAPITIDTQDRASMLMRLAGIGAAGANQFDNGIELLVAGSSGLARVSFEKVGEETLATALGELATVHLRQKVQAGEAQLEVWLAPRRSWYPVQLRLTKADGGTVTQTATTIAGVKPGDRPAGPVPGTQRTP